MMKSITKRLFGFLLIVVMMAEIIPSAVFAIGTEKAIRLVDRSGRLPVAVNIVGAQASSVYFGTYPQTSDENGGYNNDPIKWRVLQNADGKLLLLSDRNLDAFMHKSHNSTSWEDSAVRFWLNGTGLYKDSGFNGSAFTETEFAAVAETKVVTEVGFNEDIPDFGISEHTTDKVFLLSIAEAKNTAYGFTNNRDPTDTRVSLNTDYAKERGVYNYSNGAGIWWLRSSGSTPGSIASVGSDGYINSFGSTLNRYNNAVRPAYNLNLNCVLFTSAAAGGKSSGDVGQNALTAVSATDTADWKLTLLDADRSGFTASCASISGDIRTVKYRGAKSGANEYISAMIVDRTGAVTYYGRVGAAAPDPATGMNTVTVDLAGKYNDGDKFYIFNEQYNGDYMTDYASEPVEILEPVILAGSGTEEDPYQIGSKAELEKFRDIVNGESGETQNTAACARLSANIYLKKVEWTPIGNSAKPYTGIFEGLGYEISGFVHSDREKDNVGLFGTNDGTVKNLTVRCAKNDNFLGNSFVGGIVGENHGTVEHCHNISDIVGNTYVGGIVGYNTGTVEACHHEWGVFADKSYAGGIVGFNDGEIKNCYNNGSAQSVGCAGGIAGCNKLLIRNCYNTGKVVSRFGNIFLFDIVGDIQQGGTVTNCYCIGDESTFPPVFGGELLTAKQFADMDSFNDWDFTDVWFMDAAVGRPLLREPLLSRGTKKAIRFVDKSGEVPVCDNIEGAQADNLYFAYYLQSPDKQGNYTIFDHLKWRVLQNADGKLLLLSDRILDAMPYNTSFTAVDWAGSTIRSWLNGYGRGANTSGEDYSIIDNFLFCSQLIAADYAAMANTEVKYDYTAIDGTTISGITTDKVFLLSAEDVTNTDYGFSDRFSGWATRYAAVTDYAKYRGVYIRDSEYGYWWLRSPVYHNEVASVNDTGSVYDAGNLVDDKSVGVRPAINIDLNSVLFVSAAARHKDRSGLSAVLNTDTTDWKLTLFDSSRSGFKASLDSVSGDVWTISYSGAKTDHNEYISALIVNSEEEITYYGRLAAALRGSGNTVTVDLAGKYDDGDTLYIFNEQYNGDYATDYAGALQEITKPEEAVYTFTNGEELTYTKGRNNELTATVIQTGTEDASFEHFVGVYIGETELQKDVDYTVKKGSTVVTILPEALDKLDAGEYALTVRFTNGKALTKLNVRAAGSGDLTSPRTGDNSHIALWIALMALSFFGIVTTLIIGKKKRAFGK